MNNIRFYDLNLKIRKQTSFSKSSKKYLLLIICHPLVNLSNRFPQREMLASQNGNELICFFEKKESYFL